MSGMFSHGQIPDAPLPPTPTLGRRVRDAFAVLFGLRRATANPRISPGLRIGSAPDDVTAQGLAGISSAYEFFKTQTYLDSDRVSIYNDMDEMMTYILCAAALHAYVEDATQPDQKTERTLWVESANPRVQAEGTRLFDNLEMEDRVYGDLFWLGKYGDHFCLTHYERDIGVTDLTPLEPRITHRIESFQRQLLGFAIGDSPVSPMGGGEQQPPFKPWDVVHWRLRLQRPIDIYGTPFFFDVRLIYRTLKLMEEQVSMYRMNMHPDRLLFKVFVGNAAPDEAFRIIRRWRQAIERIMSFNQGTDRFTSEYGPWGLDSSIYWPVWSGDDKTGVEKVPGSANAGDLLDVAHVRDLLFAGLRVPKAYLGFEDSQGYRSEDTLSQQSVKFARGVKRLRRFLLQGYARVLRIHLELRGLSTAAPENQFMLKMAPVSYLDEAHRAELVAKRMETVRYMMEIGDTMADKLGINRTVWASYVLSEYGGLEPALVNRLLAPSSGNGEGGEKGADITYAPQGTGMMFENVEAKARTEIRSAMNGDSRLHGLVEEVAKIDAITNTGVVSESAADARFTMRPADLLAGIEARKARLAEASERSSAAVTRFEDDRRRRHHAAIEAVRSGKWPGSGKK